MEEERIGIIGITIIDKDSITEVNQIIHDNSHLVVGRMGIPYHLKNISIISLIIDGTRDEISAMTGKLGNVKGVSVKSMLTKEPERI